MPSISLSKDLVLWMSTVDPLLVDRIDIQLEACGAFLERLASRELAALDNQVLADLPKGEPRFTLYWVLLASTDDLIALHAHVGLPCPEGFARASGLLSVVLEANA